MILTWGSFDQLYPTNHIHFGYMDRMSWKNMNHYAFGLQLRPNKDSHFEVTGHLFSRQETTDGVYHAGQANSSTGLYPFLHPREPRGLAKLDLDVGEEIDVVYTHFFTPGNPTWPGKSAGIFFTRLPPDPGEFIDNFCVVGMPHAEQISWGYTQLWVNF